MYVCMYIWPLTRKKSFQSTFESKSLPVEVKENFAIVNSKYGSLVEGNHSLGSFSNDDGDAEEDAL